MLKYAASFCSLLFVVATLCASASGQELSGSSTAIAGHVSTNKRYVSNVWTVDDGLPVNHVNQIYQTPDGYIWMATFDGLVRFDGVRFVIFDAASTDLPSNRLTTIQRGLGNGFWVTTEQGDLVRVQNGQFTVFDLPIASERIRVFADGDSVLWVGARSGLLRLRNDELVPYAADVTGTSEVSAVLRTKRGELFASLRGQGVWKLAPTQHFYPASDAGMFGVHELYEDNRGAVWAGDDGVALIQQDKLVAKETFGTSWRGGPGPLPIVLRIIERNGGGYLVSSRNGLYVLDGAEAEPLDMAGPLSPTPTPAQELGAAISQCADGSIWSVVNRTVFKNEEFEFQIPVVGSAILCDSENSIWVATLGGGILRYKEPKIDAIVPPGGIRFANIYGILEDSKGGFWLGSWNEQLTRLVNGTFYRYGSELGIDGTSAAMLEASDGSLWIGRNRCKPSFRTPDGGCRQFETLRSVPARVFAITEIAGGTIMFGAGNGVYSLSVDSPAAVRDESLGRDIFARFFMNRPDGSVWVGTNGFGVHLMQSENSLHLNTANGLSSNNIRGLLEDERGILWIATEDQGLNRYDPSSGAIDVVRTSDGLLDDGLNSIVSDKSHRFWLGTNSGIFWVRRSDLDAHAADSSMRVRSTAYTERDGMLNRETNGGFQNSVLVASDGRLWFATQAGAAVIDPAEAGTIDLAVSVITESITALGETRRFDGGVQRLSAAGRNFTIRYTAPSFVAPERLRFRYRLDDFDRDWVDGLDRREAVYTNVPPGLYDFHVSVANEEGVWKETAAPVSIRVAPFYFETIWFRASVVLALMLFLSLVFRARIRQSARREEELTALVDARTSELRLEKQKTEEQARLLRELDAARSDLFANVSHEFRTPLTLILGELEDLRKLDSEHQGRHIDSAYRNALRLQRLTNQLLDLARLEAGQFQLGMSVSDIGSYVETLAGPFVTAAKRRGLDLVVSRPTEPVLVSFDPQHLDKVFANLLSNAVKYSDDGGLIRLTLKVTEGEAVVTVSDTGNGISPDQLTHIFDRFYRAENSEIRPGTGLGLAIARQLVERHNGRIRAESTVGVGSLFTVTLAVANAVAGAATSDSVASRDGHAIGDGFEEELSTEASQWISHSDDPTVLVVDDNSDMRQFIGRHLQSEGYNVVEAEDGNAALAAIGRRLPDLVISDVMMPGMDGLSLLKEIRSNRETDFVPIILLTARAEAEDRLAGLGLGADDYITKPFDAREIVLRVENLIALRRSLRERFEGLGIQSRSGTSLVIPPDCSSVDADFLETVRIGIIENLHNEDFGVDALAEEVGLSRSTLHRRLRSLIDVPPSELIWQARVECGATLLSERAGTVSEIAYAVGFKSVAHFSTRFRQQFNVSPTEYVSSLSQADSA